jgi:RND superfamily putative drug exporter
MVWQRLAQVVTGRLAWLLALAIVLASSALMAVAGDASSSGKSPISVPTGSGSAKAAAALRQFPGGDQASAILVVTRRDAAALTASDLKAVEEARARAQRTPQAVDGAAAPVVTSVDGKAALATVPLSARLSGFDLSDAVHAVRAAAAKGLPAQLAMHVTGGPAFGADIANAFAGANITLLVVTAVVVALLLIVTYRSPVLWLLPLTVVALADRVAAVVGALVAGATGLTLDGATSGITSVLVFGAGTNYALLLISRYREELRTEVDHRAALRAAVRAAGPAILASNATVVLALLMLILAVTPSTRSLGTFGGCGLVVAAVFVLLVLPPLLVLAGRKVFWPFIPRAGDASTTTTGVWHRVADAVGRRPVMVCAAAVAALAASAAGLLNTPVGLSQTQQFRIHADSVAGFDTLAAHFPGGSSGPAVVIASTAQLVPVQQAIMATPGVVSARPEGQSPAGLTRWSVVFDAAPATEAAFTTVDALRTSLRVVDPAALVGGADAEALDVRDAAVRDRLVLIPAILVVVLVVLFVLLRAVLAPPLLVAATVLSALAALGLGGWASTHLLGFPALDNSTPLFAFLFLVALGVDYTIFLVTRAIEETPGHGTRAGMVRAVSATGGVITSAGAVLAAVFCVLGVLPLIVLTQLGIIVGLGILLDTFVVRTLVIPALFAMIGDAIWWPRSVGTQTDHAENETGILTGVSETALMTLYGRAHQAAHADAIIDDPMAIKLADSIDYDFDKFGRKGQEMALRSLAFDRCAIQYLTRHPKATVVALAEGLQTSFWRLSNTVPDARFRWLTIDLPPIIELRERLLPSRPQITTLAQSALDYSWMDQVDPGDGVFITAEGLLMYLQPDDAMGLITECAKRFPGGQMIFDLPPVLVKKLAPKGMRATRRYRVPPMPFSLSARQLADLVNTVPGVRAVHDLPMPKGRGLFFGTIFPAFWQLPLVRQARGAYTLLEFG